MTHHSCIQAKYSGEEEQRGEATKGGDRNYSNKDAPIIADENVGDFPMPLVARFRTCMKDTSSPLMPGDCS